MSNSPTLRDITLLRDRIADVESCIERSTRILDDDPDNFYVMRNISSWESELERLKEQLRDLNSGMRR
ncbi:hypothetical protein D3C75_517580 [compost metagenome]